MWLQIGIALVYMRLLHHCWVLITQQTFGMESWFLAWACSIRSVNLSAGTCPNFVASTECEIGLVHNLAVERRCDDIWRLCHRSRDEFSRPSPSAFCILQVNKNWRCRSTVSHIHCMQHTCTYLQLHSCTLTRFISEWILSIGHHKTHKFWDHAQAV